MAHPASFKRKLFRRGTLCERRGGIVCIFGIFLSGSKSALTFSAVKRFIFWHSWHEEIAVAHFLITKRLFSLFSATEPIGAADGTLPRGAGPIGTNGTNGT
jgi:hypothetical protein